jgi:4-hydroxy-tetrahydrodipicolinate synthase
MPRATQYVPHGVIPAVLLPFAEDLSIDENSFRKHLRDVAETSDLSAITVNAHSTEVAAGAAHPRRFWCSRRRRSRSDSRRRWQSSTSSVLPTRVPYRLSPSSTRWRPVRDIRAETLLKLVEEVPSIRAIKDWSGNVPQHEMHVRELQSRQPPVNVLTTHSAWLLSSLVLGCNGVLSGSGSVIADLQAALFRAVQANDLAEARRLNDRIYPLARVFYADPWADMHNRMKEALVLLGRLPRAVVRPPLVKLARAEVDRIHVALVKAGLLSAKTARDAA